MNIVLAGGGTAGHIEPALNLADHLKIIDPDVNITVLGTARGLEVDLVPARGYELELIPAVPLPRKLSGELVTLPIRLRSAISQTRNLLMDLQADVVVGFGGYVSAPAYLAAKSLHIPFVVHEANAKPGFANRLGARLSPSVAVAQAVEDGALSSALVTGIPLRSDVATALSNSAGDWAKARANAKSSLGFSPTAPLVFAFFGSQGSVALNAVIEKSLPSLLANGGQLLHAVGKLNPLPKSQERYKSTSYIEDMATAYLAADLIISRSGAISCSEINALGRYALFIPLPIGNGEQRFNANHVISQGRGEVIDQEQFSPSWVSSNLNRLLAKSADAPFAGSNTDQDASEKIVNFMEHALNRKSV